MIIIASIILGGCVIVGAVIIGVAIEDTTKKDSCTYTEVPSGMQRFKKPKMPEKAEIVKLTDPIDEFLDKKDA